MYEESRTETGPPMSGVTAAMLMAIAVITAVAIYRLQIRLEQWDLERHIED